VIKTKSIYEKPEPTDGYRLLVMRYWPRGVSRYKVHSWERLLAPSADLVHVWKAGELDWTAFARSYSEQMKAQVEVLKQWRRRARHQTIALLCGCREEATCHRKLLRAMLEKSQREKG